MDLTLSRAGDYAVRAAIALAEGWDARRFVTTDEVSERMDVPRSFTPQILGMLARADLAESRSGRGGGYRLARAPGKISMLEVVEAAEGPLGTSRCPLSGGPCHWQGACAVHPTWIRATDAFRGALARSSLLQAAQEDLRLARTDHARRGRRALR